MKKSPFFDFLNRRKNVGFEQFLSDSVEDEHFIDWNQFVLPMDYGDARAEYLAIRNSCAVFDVSPLRKYRIQGAGSGEFLDHLVTRPVSTASSMRGIYVAFCNADGSLKDDAILQKFADDDYLLMPSDMDHSVYFEALCGQFGISDVVIADCTGSWVGLAFQGPLSATVLHHMGLGGIDLLEPMAIKDYVLAGGTVRVARMGFTADLGYECWFQPGLRTVFEQSIRSVRDTTGIDVPGYGLTALEACRLEGGFIVAGWDCATEADPEPGFERSPYELGLGWLVNLEASDFVGREALLQEQKSGSRFTQRSLVIEDPRKPLDGARLYATIDGRDVTVGRINCSSWSWSLSKMIGNASIESRFADIREAWTKQEQDEITVSLSRGPLMKFPRSRQVPAPIERVITGP